MINNQKYWDAFYVDNEIEKPNPSTFAKFIENIINNQFVVEYLDKK